MDKPQEGKIYALTGATGAKAISNGNTWAESEVKKEITAKEIPKIVKKALAEIYGFKNVTANRGRGTAWGWVEARIKVAKPSSCICSPTTRYCEACRLTLRTAEANANKAVYAAMNMAGAKFYTYCSDDGMGVERDEFLLQADFI